MYEQQQAKINDERIWKMRQTINLSTGAPRISRFYFPAKIAKKVGPGGTQDCGGDSGPMGTWDRGLGTEGG